jgi:NifU-like protein
MWEYSEKVWDRIRNPRNAGAMESPDAVGDAGSLACGDALRIMLKLDENDRIADAKYQTFGCGSAVASGSALTELIVGKTLDEAAKITNDDIVEYLDGLPEEKMHCSVMGMEALQAAIANYRGEQPGEAEEGNIVCECFGITEEKIRDAIRRNNLTTVDHVTHFTKAGGGCGKCHDDIQRILDEELAGREAGPEKPEPRRLTNIQKMKMVEDAIEKHIAPILRADGGDLELVDIEGDKVLVALRGRCAECVASGFTMSQVVQTRLRELVDEHLVVEEVRP